MKPLIYFTIVTICAAAAAQIGRYRIVTMIPAEDGATTFYQPVAAEKWVMTPLTATGALHPSIRGGLPQPNDKRPLIVDYMNGTIPRVMFFYDDRFRVARAADGTPGNVQANPKRWAYLRLAEDRLVGDRWERAEPGLSKPFTSDLRYLVWLAESEHGKQAIFDELIAHPKPFKPDLKKTLEMLNKHYSKTALMNVADTLVWQPHIGAPEE